jgi:hypothetical protein
MAVAVVWCCQELLSGGNLQTHDLPVFFAKVSLVLVGIGLGLVFLSLWMFGPKGWLARKYGGRGIPLSESLSSTKSDDDPTR